MYICIDILAFQNGHCLKITFSLILSTYSLCKNFSSFIALGTLSRAMMNRTSGCDHPDLCLTRVLPKYHIKCVPCSLG